MIEIAQKYFQLLLTERDLSWALLGIIYVLFAYFVRGWFLGPLAASTRVLDRQYAKPLKSAYLKYSIWGWTFFFIPLGLLIMLWTKMPLPFPCPPRLILLAAFASFVLSIIFHLEAFGFAAVSALKSIQDQKEKSLEA